MTNESLHEGMAYAQPYTKLDHVADYIPKLGYVDPSALGVSIRCPDGSHFQAGSFCQRFTIQSISKVVNLGKR